MFHLFVSSCYHNKNCVFLFLDYSILWKPQLVIAPLITRLLEIAHCRVFVHIYFHVAVVHVDICIIYIRTADTYSDTSLKHVTQVLFPAMTVILQLSHLCGRIDITRRPRCGCTVSSGFLKPAGPTLGAIFWKNSETWRKAHEEIMFTWFSKKTVQFDSTLY